MILGMLFGLQLIFVGLQLLVACLVTCLCYLYSVDVACLLSLFRFC